MISEEDHGEGLRILGRWTPQRDEVVQNPALDDVALGTVASEAAWDAILSSVHGP